MFGKCKMICDGTNTICFRLQSEKWMNVRVGDIIKLENDQFVAVSVKSFLIHYNQQANVNIANIINIADMAITSCALYQP